MKNKIGTIGVLVGLIALSSAFLSPWIISQIAPPPPVEVSIVRFASKLKTAALAKAKGEAYQIEEEPSGPEAMVIPIIITISMIAIALGVFSVLKSERKTIGKVAIGLGLAASIVQWSILIALIAIILSFVAYLADKLGLDIDFG